MILLVTVLPEFLRPWKRLQESWHDEKSGFVWSWSFNPLSLLHLKLKKLIASFVSFLLRFHQPYIFVIITLFSGPLFITLSLYSFTSSSWPFTLFTKPYPWSRWGRLIRNLPFQSFYEKKTRMNELNTLCESASGMADSDPTTFIKNARFTHCRICMSNAIQMCKGAGYEVLTTCSARNVDFVSIGSTALLMRRRTSLSQQLWWQDSCRACIMVLVVVPWLCKGCGFFQMRNRFLRLRVGLSAFNQHDNILAVYAVRGTW